jgi:hypothetical protein
MENQNPSIRLFQLIKNKSDEQTALNAVSVLQDTIKDEVKTEITGKINELKTELLERIKSTELSLISRINSTELGLTHKINSLETDLIDRINTSKIHTITWIVSMSILQLIARYFFK